jgi:hypothetical protein
MNTSAEQKRRPGRVRLDELGIALIDADNHYYEPHDGVPAAALRKVTIGTHRKAPLR